MIHNNYQYNSTYQVISEINFLLCEVYVKSCEVSVSNLA